MCIVDGEHLTCVDLLIAKLRKMKFLKTKKTAVLAFAKPGNI